MLNPTAVLAVVLLSTIAVSCDNLFVVLPGGRTHAEGIAACKVEGLRMAQVNAQNFVAAQNASNMAAEGAWVYSWNGDNYTGSCLLVKKGAIVSLNCSEHHEILCERVGADHDNHQSSHYFTSSVKKPARNHTSSSMNMDMDMADSTPSASDLESSDIEISHSHDDFPTSVSKDVRSLSRSHKHRQSPFVKKSSDDLKTDKCCANLKSLIYQPRFRPVEYMKKVVLRLLAVETFGAVSLWCPNVFFLAEDLGIVNFKVLNSSGNVICFSAINSGKMTAVWSYDDGATYVTYQNASFTGTLPSPINMSTFYPVIRSSALKAGAFGALIGTKVYAAVSQYDKYGGQNTFVVDKDLTDLAFVKRYY